ncbi:hypothetical protein BU17DRAFT_80134 [Hysterangium stoloniferum]|nr:hypothetical protein BU17DRAFT_80134 [Hysterangium stoloniferum]
MPVTASTQSGSRSSRALSPANPPSTQSLLPSHQGSHHRPLRVPSLPQIDATKFTPPRIARRASQNTIQTTTPSVSSEPLNAAVPNSSRPKSPRKRYHNRTRSSSKASVPGQLSTTTSLASLGEKGKEKELLPPNSAVSSNVENQTSGLRTDIDTLVERVRAMAMAGSAVERDKDKRGHQVSGDGHFDWAGDEDDTLPDLDDWVRPKSVELKESDKAEIKGSTGKLTLPTVVEVLNPRLQNQDVQSAERGSSLPGLPQGEAIADTLDPKLTDSIRSSQDNIPRKVKTRGRHTRGKNSASDANKVPKPRPLPLDPATLSKGVVLPPNKPLIHPLPPKPQINMSSSTAHRPKTTCQPPSDVSKAMFTGPVTLPSELFSQNSQLLPNIQVSQEIGDSVEGKVSDSSARPKAFDPSIDLVSAPSLSPSPSDISPTETIDNSSHDPSPVSESVPSTQPQKRALDPSVDWASAPRNQPHPRSRSSHSRSSSFSPPSVKHHLTGGFGGPDLPHTVPPLENERRPFFSPQLLPSDIPPIQTRSQRNSPERTQQVRNEGAFTHLRAHSSPQTGQGSRVSRPIITVGGLSIISRTLGVAGVSTPPRGQSVEISTGAVSSTD